MPAQPWLIRSEMQPAFDGGFIQSKFLIGGIFVVKSKAQRNAIHILNRRLDASTTTLVVVSDENRIYRLVSNPNSLTTADINWEVFFIGQTSSFRPVGTWDADNNILILSDADALNRNGEFYFVSDAPTQRTVQYPTLFGGIAVDVVDGDLIVSVGNKWSVITSTVQWDALSKPQSITDYVNGIVIAHTHTIANIDSLQVTLDAKFDSGDVADSNIDFALVPNASIVDVEFLRQFYYTKVETSGIGVIDGDKGDIIVTGTGTIWSIDGSVTLNNKVYKLNTSAVDLPSPALGYIYYDTAKNDARLYTGSWSNITRPAYFTIASTSFTLTEAHRNAYIYFTAATLVTVTLPLGLSSGFSANLIKSGLGDVRLSTSGGYQAISDSTDILTQHTGVTVYLKPGDVWSAIGALGNVTGGGGVGVTDGDKGHIIVTSDGSVWTIDPTVTLDNKVYSLRTNSSALSSPVEGWMYYDTTADDLRVYSNTAWTNTTRPAYFTSAATSFTLTEAHRNSYIYFTAATTITITLPITLAAGFIANLIMAGTGTLLLTTPGGYEAIGDANTVQERYTGVTVYLKPSNTWSAIGALGSVVGGSGYTDEQVRDVLAATLIAGNGTTWVNDDAGNTIKVNIGGFLTEDVYLDGNYNIYIRGSKFTGGSYSNTNTNTGGFVWGTGCINKGLYSIVFGSSNESETTNTLGLMHGEGNYASAWGSIAFGRGTKSSGAFAFAGGCYLPGGGASNFGKVNTKAPLVAAVASFGWFSTDFSQVDGNGILSEQSAVLGGINPHIPVDSLRNVILGGNAIKARAAENDQVYVTHLNIVGTPAIDDALTRVLVQDPTTGQVKYRNASSFGGGGGSLPTVSNLTSATTVTISGVERFLTGDATAASFTTTIPTPVGNAGYKIVCKKIDNTINTWTISTPAGLIDTASTVIIKYSLDSVTLESNGTNWYII